MSDSTDRVLASIDEEELLRTMAEQLAQMFENMRYAEAGVFVRRYVAGLADTTGATRELESRPGNRPMEAQ